MSNAQEPFIGQPAPRPYRPHRHPPSFFWPLFLIAAGILLLLTNLGLVPWQSWNVLLRLWPLLLIAVGIDVLFGRRSWIGAIVSGLLILLLIGAAIVAVLLAPRIPGLANLARPAEWLTEHVEHPLAGIERASVTIDWTSLPGRLSALRDSSNLIEGNVAYRGELIFDVDQHGDQADVELDTRFTGPWFGPFGFSGQTTDRWDVRLSPEVPLDLVLDTGSGPCDLDLAGLEVSSLILDAGSGPVDLALPAASTFEARIEGGSGPLTIVLPEGVGARVELDSGSGPFNPDRRFRLVEGERDDDGTWETDDFDTAEHRIELSIDQGSGPLTIR